MKIEFSKYSENLFKAASNIFIAKPEKMAILDVFQQNESETPPSAEIFWFSDSKTESLREGQAQPPQNETDNSSRIESGRNDGNLLKDGYDSSRDITGAEAFEGKPGEPYRFRVNLNHIRPDAELKNLNVYTLISLDNDKGAKNLPDHINGRTEIPWNMALKAYDNKNFKAVGSDGNLIPNALSGINFNQPFNQVEFALNKDVLRQQGWKDGTSLKLQVLTTKDFGNTIADSLDSWQNKPWKHDNTLSAYFDTSKPQTETSPKNTNWAKENLYFVLTDRFEDGDKTNNADVEPGNLKRFQGGDLQGIIDKLDYLKNLGVNNIWISPPMEGETEFLDSDGYHGYWVKDFFAVDEHEGDMNKFKEMVEAAHQRDMKIILDIPLNHVAWEHPFVSDPDKKDWFHHIGDIKDWNDQYQIENGSMYGLPDFAQENPQVYDYLLDVSKFWIKEGKVDGFRLDAVRHIPKDFWNKYCADIREYAGPDFFMVGEIIHGDPKKIAPYQYEGMPSTIDMPLYYSIRDSIAFDGSMRILANQVNKLENEYDNPSMMTLMLDNHDTDRFISMAGNNGRDKLKLALGFMFTTNRIPCLYYGTESAMTGHHEFSFSKAKSHENRDMMKFGADPEMEKYVKDLARIRANSKALSEGNILEMWQDSDIYAYSRIHPKDEAIVVLNNSYNCEDRNIPIRKESSLRNGQILKDALTGRRFEVKEGKLQIQTLPKQALILVPEETK